MSNETHRAACSYSEHVYLAGGSRLSKVPATCRLVNWTCFTAIAKRACSSEQLSIAKSHVSPPHPRLHAFGSVEGKQSAMATLFFSFGGLFQGELERIR